MATVRLYGHLKRFGNSFEFDIRRPSEAVKALLVNFKGFEAALRVGAYRVIVDGEVVPEASLTDPLGPARVIKIVPVIQGASGAVGSVLGVALIAVALFVPGLQPLAAYAIGGLGVALTINGLTSILAPTPTDNTADQRDVRRNENRYFSDASNTESQGQPMPIVYGEMLVGSLVGSSGTVIE